MKVGILGSGPVATVLAGGFHRHGHTVMVGTRDTDRLADWLADHPGATAGSVLWAATSAEIIVLAVKGDAAAAVLRAAGVPALEGKVVIDATNPIAEGPPDHGVLKFFTTLEDSLMERLQREFPAVRFVKAFNSVGNAYMVNPQLPGGPPTMFICGNDPEAKETVTRILDQFGWDTADMGTAEAARAIEPLCILWCLPGFTRNEWRHAFRLLREDG